ncbi:MAG: SIR2 family protein [Bacteroidetes bacterium]|nr:SIR2 family protein [Bacteroidota bacterium]
MDNLLTSISFSVHSNKGVYALLLGSGLSQPSGIPTGWDVLMDLIRKLAILNSETEVSDPVTWFSEKNGSPPNYSTLLAELVNTQAERVTLMRPYFEPTDDERERGLKQPTLAHQYIARLTKKGFFKVILTTNFDRLLEKAFENEGVIPQVIRNEDDIDGAIPYIHANCTIIKVNGDYLDCQFRNTPDELAGYGVRWNELLQQIFEDFGIITCGWSAKWDKGLVDLIRRSKNRRYANYFTDKNPSSELQELNEFRKGSIVKIKDANTFFSELHESIEALDMFSANHTLTKDIAIARVKKYIAKSEYRISLHDFFDEETKKASSMIKQKGNYDFCVDKEKFNEYWIWHLKSIELLVSMCKTAVQWSSIDNEKIVIEPCRVLAYPPNITGRYVVDSVKLHYLSSLVIFYVIGISAIRYEKYHLLNALFQLQVIEIDSEPTNQIPIIDLLNASLIEKDTFNDLLGSRYYTPLSTFLNKSLREFLLDLFDGIGGYNEAFDIFEYLSALNYSDILNITDWAPFGEFVWRRSANYRMENNGYVNFFKKGGDMQDDWPLLKDGRMFGGSYSHYLKVMSNVEEFLKKLHF